MNSWQKRPYLGQWVFIGIAALLGVVLISPAPWADSFGGISYFWLLIGGTVAALLHGVYPSIATWWIAAAVFCFLCFEVLAQHVQNWFFFVQDYPETKTDHVLLALLIMLLFTAIGIVALVQFRRAMMRHDA
jgi:hypothetical protein